MQKLLLAVDKVSTLVGQVFSWLIVVLTFLISWEVFSRYALDNPHPWAFDVMSMMYGTLFMTAGAYTLSKNGHVRGDVLYGFFPPRLQAGLDLTLYILFFIPGVVALAWAGYNFAAESWAINEHSNVTANGPPVYPFKTIIPIAGAILLAQGLVEIVRCIVCLQQGEWPSRGADVEEVDVEKLKEMVHVKDDDIAKLDALVVHSALVVVAIMLGFPTAFTLMGMGMVFAWIAYRSQNPDLAVQQTLDLMVQRTYSVMSNDVLISIPLFVFMGYLIERANLIEKLFKSMHLATARVPGSLAVATIITCAIFATATGIVGAVVTLMGLLAAARANDKALAPFSGLLLNNKRLICVLNLELDPQPGWRPGEGGRLLGLLKSRIERELSFIKDTEVIIWSGLRPLTPPSYSWEILVSA